MRAAGRGRIVVVSSQGGVRGMPTISAYSAAKGALERWAEALSPEVAPFGIGVTVLVAGTFKTDILELTQTYADPDGPYAAHHAALERAGRWVPRLASPPERFAPAVARAVTDRAPFARRAVGPDAAPDGARQSPPAGPGSSSGRRAGRWACRARVRSATTPPGWPPSPRRSEDRESLAEPRTVACSVGC